MREQVNMIKVISDGVFFGWTNNFDLWNYNNFKFRPNEYNVRPLAMHLVYGDMLFIVSNQVKDIIVLKFADEPKHEWWCEINDNDIYHLLVDHDKYTKHRHNIDRFHPLMSSRYIRK